jgi:hypothetical protein
MRRGARGGKLRTMPHSTDIPLEYVECDLPDGMTLVEWRRTKVAAARSSREEAKASARAARAASLKRLLPRLGTPQPAFRPRFA